MSDTISTAHQKALRLNFESPAYGSFAEIGAAQEVARWFFVVGGAARSVAKSISAYDMALSDSLYGPAPHYVSRQRLEAMLEYEYGRLVSSLDAARQASSTLFAFADTVTTVRHGTGHKGRGWVGLRFQTRPAEPPSQIILHVHLLDKETVRQQQSLGVLGVNLIYGAFYRCGELTSLVASLADDLSRDNIDIDVIKTSGPAFAGFDNRLLSLELIEQRLADATMFLASGEVVQPAEILQGRPVLVERGSFRPATKLTLDLLERARSRFIAEPAVKGSEPVVLAEMTLRDLLSGAKVDHQDFLSRADILNTLGIDVLISRFQPYYQLADYLVEYTDRMIGIALGLPGLREVVDEKYYTDISGGMLESLGRLFKRSLKMYVYPMLDPATGEVVSVERARLPSPAHHLRDFLLELGQLEPLLDYERRYLPIRTKDVLASLQSGDASWEEMVPASVARSIKEHRLFGYRG